ncbi:amidohydrolase family protein [Muricoccus pecuniae]|uniref:Putative TIM-barrel fold metal-dependent hydrolase n=1 Tax=Muricoccus pecuniae TaxID=693023 RepID=A0A840YBZ4_9PROT|nr:amidohydrolase family protein [Roseomonas pecuniae]MBB5696229.1 putative TIM-barrel fold metal-dependent hydrolase [Roseomonas pecuniae]
MSADSGTSVVEPDLPVIDSHHHLWVHHGDRYLIEEFAADAASGHRIVASVFVECGAMLRRHGPPEFRTVGEVEFAAGIAAMSESGLYGPTRICAAIIGRADLQVGARVGEVLDALAAAGGGRFRGIRSPTVWDADPALNLGVRPYAPPGLLLDPTYREGFARLAERDLVYEAWQFFPQLPDLCGLADAFPETAIVVNHCGGLVGLNAYAGLETFPRWKAFVTEVARRPNTLMKIGGLSGRRCGFGLQERATPPAAEDLARLWRPYVETCIELFGPSRCLFESNFPPDRAAGSYRTVWNGLKLAVAGCSAEEKRDLFSETARRVYRLDLP